jgi:hypothetical protein
MKKKEQKKGETARNNSDIALGGKYSVFPHQGR